MALGEREFHENGRDECHALFGGIRFYVFIISIDLDVTRSKISQHSVVWHL
jgi:hypothetical protein